MELVFLQSLVEELAAVGTNLFVGLLSREVNPSTASHRQRVHVLSKTVASRLLRKDPCRLLNQVGRYRGWIAIQGRYASIGISLTDTLNCLTHTAGAQFDFQRRNRRARHGEHECCSVAEVADPGDRPRAVRKVVDLGQPLPNVLELLVGVLDVVQQADEDYRHIVLSRRFNPIHLRVPRRCLLDLSGDQLLYLVGRNPWPWTDRQPHAHWDVGVFAFWHVYVRKDAPGESREQCYPGNLTVLGEESRYIALVVWAIVFQLRTSTRCPSLVRFAPVVMIRSPEAKPLSTVISLPDTSPISTARSRATSPPPDFESRNTPYFPPGD